MNQKKPRLDSWDFGRQNPLRFNVIREFGWDGPNYWAVFQGNNAIVFPDGELAHFPTHAEAIAYAQRAAHRATDCTHRCGACRDLNHQHIACCPERRNA